MLCALENLIQAQTRAVVLVNPNNPTGQYLKNAEASRLEALALRHNLAIISDEVFADYSFSQDPQRETVWAKNRGALSFSLSGLSKVLRAVRGEKHIILLSEGFDSRLIQGRDAGTSEQGQEEQQMVENGQFWNVDNDNRYGSSASCLALILPRACSRPSSPTRRLARTGQG